MTTNGIFTSFKKTDKEDEGTWAIMADKADYALMSVSTTELGQHYSKPEYAEPKAHGK